MKKWFAPAAVIAVLVGIAVMYSLRTAGQQPAPQVQRSQVNVTWVKPDMIDEFLDFQVKQTLPALKKAGVPQRDLYQSVLGPAFEFRSVTPITNFAERDSFASPIEKALGAAGYKEYNAAVRKLITSQQISVIQSIADASYDPNPNATFRILVLSMDHVAPGRETEYLNYQKNDILPLQQKGQVKRRLVNQVVFGGDPMEYRTATYMDKYADLDTGPAVTRVLGAAGALELRKKTAGVISSTQRGVYVRLDALSYRTGTSTN